MKRIFILLLVILGIMACENQPLSFGDFDFKSVYFPVQLPLRTLSLGEDRIDNTLDKQYIFDIAVSIGGMYENKKDWTVDYMLDTSLTTKVYTSTTPSLKIMPLPPAYYTMSPLNTITIPKGLFNGRTRIQLTSAFFDDTLAITGQYVIPLKITGSSADTILTGQAASGIANPDPRNKSDWESNKSPKDWVMYGIKYVNAYHGTYFHRGRDIQVTTATGIPFNTVVFRNRYVERDAQIKLTTIGRTKVITNGVGPLAGTNSMTLTFDNDKGNSGSVTISPRVGSPISVTGTGQYYDKASSVEQWTLLIWQSMYLSYTYQDATLTHNITDTLVFRDRGIKWEELSIIIK